MAKNDQTTKIGVLSDTHMPEAGIIPLRLLSEMEHVDLIIHLGDFCNMECYRELQKIAPIIAVHGNMDEPDVKDHLPEKKTIEVQGYNLGLIHGWGPPKNLEKRVVQTFQDINIILFGHSHVPHSSYWDNVFLFNPGSATMNKDGTATFGILELGETITHQIIRIDS